MLITPLGTARTRARLFFLMRTMATYSYGGALLQCVINIWRFEVEWLAVGLRQLFTEPGGVESPVRGQQGPAVYLGDEKNRRIRD
jgi:hypothetical protein